MPSELCRRNCDSRAWMCAGERQITFCRSCCKHSLLPPLLALLFLLLLHITI